MDSSRHKKSKPFHLVGAFLWNVPKFIWMKKSKSSLLKPSEFQKLEIWLQSISSDTKSLQTLRIKDQTDPSANSFRSLHLHGWIPDIQEFRPLPAIRAQEVATPSEHAQLVSKLHAIADGLETQRKTRRFLSKFGWKSNHLKWRIYSNRLHTRYKEQLQNPPHNVLRIIVNGSTHCNRI